MMVTSSFSASRDVVDIWCDLYQTVFPSSRDKFIEAGTLCILTLRQYHVDVPGLLFVLIFNKVSLGRPEDIFHLSEDVLVQ